MRKILMAAVLAGAALAVGAPSASAAESYPAGVYPNGPAAEAACAQGIQQGRWKACSYTFVAGGQAVLWVVV
ncbi:hypothetical protein [Amycolatopsis minnesotensis]